jgi:hypothetical protein
LRNIMIAGVALILAGCSMQGAIDKMASAEEKKLATGFAEAICNGSLAPYQDMVEPTLWIDSQPLLPQAKVYCPTESAKFRLMGYRFDVNSDSNGTVRAVKMAALAESPGKWTVATIDTLEKNGKRQIVAWNLNAFNEKPEDLAAMEAWDNNVIYLQIGIPLLLLGMIGGVVWLFRRSRAKRQ